MKFSTVLVSTLSLVTPAISQATSADYVDKGSGIQFQLYQNSQNGLFFGAALPTNGTGTDFIGILGGKGAGYSGVSLGGGMGDKLLIVAWANGQSVVSSFRKVP